MKRGEVARNVTRGAFYLGLEKGISSLSTLVYMALLSRWLGPTKYGMFVLAFSFVSLSTAFSGNFEAYLERFAAEYQVRDRLRTLRRAFGITIGLKFGLSLVVAAVLLVVAPMLARAYRIEELGYLLPLLAAFMVADGVGAAGRSMLFGLQHFGWVSLLSLVFSVGRAVLVGLLWYSQHGLRSLAVGLSVLAALQSLLFCATSLVLLARQRAARSAAQGAEPPVEPGLVRQIVKYCWPLIFANLSFLGGQNMSKIVLGMLFDPTQLGYFVFAMATVEKFVEVVYTLPRALLPSLTQIVALGDRERLHHVFGQAFRLVQVVACMLSFGLFVYAREIVLLVGSPLFEPAIPLLRALALVPLVRTAQQPLTMLFQATSRTVHVLQLALIKLTAEALGYLVLLLLPIPWRALGACWANLGGAVVAFVGAMLMARMVLPEGRTERAGVVLRSTAIMVPLLLAALAADRWLGPLNSLVVRLPLLVPAVLAVFALGLFNRYDLEKVSSLPMPAAWLARVREGLVAVTERLIRMFEPRRAA